MKAEDKIARQRLSVLELAQTLGSVTQACRQRGVARSRFYEYKKRFTAQGIEGLKDLPPIHKSHPQTTAPEVIEKLLDLALAHPSYGCNRLEQLLALEGIRLSSVTIQKLLNDRQLGTRFERWLALEQKAIQEGYHLTPEQMAYLEKLNPQHKERHVESSAPGELLSQDVFFVGHFKGVGKVYAHTLVDTYGSLGFAFLHTSKQPEAAVSLLHNDVLPFYQKHKVPVKAVLTDNGREFCGSPTHLETHAYELYLQLNDIQHRRTRVRSPQTNGFVERFHRTLLEEFFAIKLREKLYESVEALQEDLDEWLVFYNKERPHLGYRNQGRRPIDTFFAFKKGELLPSHADSREG
jgi:transposase InsO family protein